MLALDADHPGARAILGYERVFGEWLSGDALKRTRGWVRHEGAWMTLVQRKALLERESHAPGPSGPPTAAIPLLVTLRFEDPKSAVLTRFVLMDGGAAARELARRAGVRFGRREGDAQGARPWRPEPFRVGYSALGIPPPEPVGSRIGF